jgi:predicted aminopeptidase
MMAVGVKERTAGRRVWRWGGIAFVVAAFAFVALPVGRYLLRGAWEEGKILAGRRAITDVIADSAAAMDTRGRLRLVLDARTFAATSLGLRARESFTTYTKLAHDTLVLVVSAAQRDLLVARTWWFPIVGRVPYKGFFDFGEADRAAQELHAQDFDTYVRPASAFSTLGWFNDPLLSTTLGLDTLSLANTVIHELTHNTVFVPSQVTFNESFASFVGARGAIAFFRARGAQAAADASARHWEDDKLLAAFWLTAKGAIDSAFAANPSDRAARLAGREIVYRHLRSVLLDDLAPHMSTVSRRSLERLALDNASLLAHQVYASEPWLFDEVLRRMAGDLRETVKLIARLVRGADDPFAAVRAWLQTNTAVDPALAPTLAVGGMTPAHDVRGPPRRAEVRAVGRRTAPASSREGRSSPAPEGLQGRESLHTSARPSP